ncbi:unnamed protein product [Cylicocyclus nassatus]|uniref:Uncharacterized protein n=1 Tax=Cylicocyclus nassatus TaxID=53992 RepID=A0AA36GPX9_CYLNA|nr:unnamed protein product [Cylicocyclus nassatus]
MLRYTAGQQLDNTTMFDDRHFFPQNWRCEFNSHLRDYHMLRYNTDDPSSFIKDMVTIFKKQNVTDTAIEHIETSLAFNRTEHSTRGTAEQQKVRKAILTSEYHLDLLIKMFYYDFVLFGFPIPEVQMTEDN